MKIPDFTKNIIKIKNNAASLIGRRSFFPFYYVCYIGQIKISIKITEPFGVSQKYIVKGGGDGLDGITDLINEHGNAVYNFCLYLAKSRNDGEDLFQETFVRAIELSSKIDKQNNPKSYLMSIAVNIWKDTVQKRARRHRITQTIDTGSVDVSEFADPNTNIESGVINKMMSNTLLGIINKLDDKYRIPIILFYSEEMKIVEIASLLRKPEGTVKRRLHEAKSRIKKEMEEMGYE